MKLSKYHGAAIAAFAVWGFIPFPLRALTALESTQILFFRILMALGLLLLITFVFRRESVKTTRLLLKTAPAKEKRQFWLFALLGGLLLATNWLAYIFVINHVNIQTASFSYLVCPILTALLGVLLLKEKLRTNQWLAIGLSILSCALIGANSFYNLMFSIIIAGSYALYLITQRLLKAYDKIVLLTLQLVLAFSLIGPAHMLFNTAGLGALNLPEAAWLFLLSAVFTVLPLFLNLFALKELTSGAVGILMYLNPLINFLMAFLYFKEKATLTQAIAYTIILASVVLYNMSFARLNPKAAIS